MTTQQQEQRPDQRDTRGRQRRRLSRRALVIITVLLLAVAIIITWTLSYLNVIPNFLASIFTIIITVLGAVFAFLQSMHLFIPFDKHEASETLSHSSENTYIPIASPAASPSSEKPSYRGIVGLPPLTSPRTIQQREQVVGEVYSKLIRPDITAIALTGIGGVGKSTLASLVYHYVEEQRQTHTSPFVAVTLWLTIDPAVTFADLAGNLFEALGRSLPDLGNLAPQNQAVALFNALNTIEKPRLVILDQFENLLDWNTGHALADRPGVGEWLDIINSHLCACRIVLTSRPRPVGTREYPSTYLQEYAVGGLEESEGVALLRNQSVQGTDKELQAAVSRCAGHAFSLTLLASLLRDHHLNLAALFKLALLWTGDIATNLLDQIYQERLDDVQRELLLAFSVYREPSLFEAAQAIIPHAAKGQLPSALKTLRTQRLLEAIGDGRYQLHAIIADYAQTHFNESNEQANEEALHTAHARAALYYLEQATKNCLSREQRQKVNDVHDLIETIWHYCQADKWQEAYNLMERESLFADLKRWGGNTVLLELYQMMLLGKWQPEHLQAARIYNNLGRVCSSLGQMEQAKKYLEQALSILREVGNRADEGVTLNYLGRVCDDLGQKKQAREYLERALDIHKEAGNRRGEGGTLNNLGRFYSALGEKQRALEFFEEALVIRREGGDRRGEGATLSNLGLVYADLGQKEQARIYYEEALSIHREVGARGGEGATLTNLGRVLIDLGEEVRARQYFEEALVIRREIGDRGGEGTTLKHLGQFYSLLGKTEQAQDYLQQALSIMREVGDRREEGLTLNYIGQFYSLLGKKELAFKYLEQALVILKRVGDQRGESLVLENISILYLEQRRYDIALASLLLAKAILEEVRHPYSEEISKYIEKIHQEIGEEHFSSLLATVQPQTQQIVDQALLERMQ